MKSITYEIILHNMDDEKEIVVDVRKTVSNADGNEEYEQFSEEYSFTERTLYDRYRQAKKQMVQLVNKYTNKIMEHDINHPQNDHTLLENDTIFLDSLLHFENLEAIKDEAEKELEHNK